MIVLDPGHDFVLSNLDGQSQSRLTFVKREGERFPGNFGHHPGTTSQEVVRALINRAQYVQRQIPCWQTRLSVHLMRAVIWLYEHRAARTHGRRWFRRLRGVELLPTCIACGHIDCTMHALDKRNQGT